MKIGINLLFLLPDVVGGTETYARGLLHGLSKSGTGHQFVVFVNRESAHWPIPTTENFRKIVCPVFAESRMMRYFHEQVRLRGQLRNESADLVHSLGYVCPLFPGCPSVVTVHDLNYRAFGDSMSLMRRYVFGAFTRLSIARADVVIAVSAFSRSEILRTYPVPGEKVVVTHEAAQFTMAERRGMPQQESLLKAFRISSPYIVAFSSSSPHKNIPVLIRAYSKAKLEYGIRHSLVLVGHLNTDVHLHELARSLGVESSVIFTGHIPRKDVEAVVGGADLMVFPSTYEGFGLPVLEAMALGVPVVCSRTSSLPEVAGDAAVFFDPNSVDDMAKEIVSVACNPSLRDTLREKGRINLKRFSWEQTASATLEAYEKALVFRSSRTPERAGSIAHG